MIDISQTTIAKSNQQNADDYISGPRTITITKVEATGKEDQPIAVFFEGDDGKPFLPCKTCRRVMQAVWGKYANEYPGQSMTIYRDDKVEFGGLAVGGIRISHMTGIDKAQTLVFLAKRGSKKPIVVQPLVLEKAATKTAKQPQDLLAWSQSILDNLPKATDAAKLTAYFATRADELEEREPARFELVSTRVAARVEELTSTAQQDGEGA